jgi:hypothetical protein
MDAFKWPGAAYLVVNRRANLECQAHAYGPSLESVSIGSTASIPFGVIDYLPDWKLKYTKTAIRRSAKPPTIAMPDFGLRLV